MKKIILVMMIFVGSVGIVTNAFGKVDRESSRYICNGSEVIYFEELKGGVR